jgi:hypothetical protein
MVVIIWCTFSHVNRRHPIIKGGYETLFGQGQRGSFGH